MDSPFRHLRFNTKHDQNILKFEKKGNLIRAGKHTHADGLLSVIKFILWAKQEKWFTGIATPNSVMNGSFVGTMDKSVSTYPKASSTNKFPGISISMHSEEKTNTCTPELYLRRGAFIVPGVKCPKDLVECLIELNKIYETYKVQNG